MKHRLLLLLLFVFTAVMTGWAQNSAMPSYTVKGVLLDSLTQDGEPYATIKITKKGAPDKAVKMAVTGANGRFQEKLNVGAGDYVITISSIGKAPVTKEFTLKPSVRVIDLGTMLSAEANNELKGVEVVAQKPLVKVDVDKIEYNIEDDPDSKSNSILEMLRKVPLVTVDGEDNIQVNGSSSFKIHVNGKPNNMMSNNPKEVLKSMPANSIKYIEVITSPGAKYDAEGVGGILNIVTVGGGFEGYTATFRANASNYGAGAGGYAMVKQGKIIDYGLKDNQNMGACMAPAACDTIAQNLVDFNREPADYDRIVTGDLGVVGREILLELLKKKGYDISEQHSDCGMLIFDPAKQDTGAGGSGCGCAASVLAEYLLPKLENGEWKRILFVPTGALMSKVSFQEGSSVPGIAQAVVIEREEDV